ncbi:hypothetical protein M430DRAFT_21140 [Amorphotheca resinae ATCC 22711]|uniref:Uncharacterized protein n=1 Tax=Amorphotheca resinae ATCC 22711 TaxID=857342 RepID=A0A2T3AX43_AMORE|nr:hypothetical protein M430DRAFT_21140 [Amorphotheca resinae ATCC 22711]PSS13231.1 hypothetical protein M430DRAFT_21140 [Amorphotheca resinae ATCC 22711]
MLFPPGDKKLIDRKTKSSTTETDASKEHVLQRVGHYLVPLQGSRHPLGCYWLLLPTSVAYKKTQEGAAASVQTQVCPRTMPASPRLAMPNGARLVTVQGSSRVLAGGSPEQISGRSQPHPAGRKTMWNRESAGEGLAAGPRESWAEDIWRLLAGPPVHQQWAGRTTIDILLEPG